MVPRHIGINDHTTWKFVQCSSASFYVTYLSRRLQTSTYEHANSNTLTTSNCKCSKYPCETYNENVKEM